MDHDTTYGENEHGFLRIAVLPPPVRPLSETGVFHITHLELEGHGSSITELENFDSPRW